LKLWGIAAVLAAGMVAGAAQAEPVKIRVSWAVTPGELTPVLSLKPDLTTHLGKSYTLETPHFAGSPEMVTALATGAVDIIPVAFSTLVTAVQNAKIDDLRIIADEFQDGVGDYYSNPFMVRKDSGINKVEDLKGKVIATNGAGSPIDIAMRAMLRKHGLDEKKDVTIIEINLPNMRSALVERKADLAMLVTPFSFDPAVREAGKTLFTTKDALGPTEFIMWGSRASFLTANRAAVVDFLEDVLRVTRWFSDPKNHDAVVKLFADFTKRAPETLGYVYTKSDYFRDPGLLVNLAALQSNVETEKEIGLIKTTIDVKRYADLSLVEEAGKRLK